LCATSDPAPKAIPVTKVDPIPLIIDGFLYVVFPYELGLIGLDDVKLLLYPGLGERDLELPPLLGIFL
jgi:hypothetical protein